MTTWDDNPNDYAHAVAIIHRLREALRDIHDDLNASYPWAYHFEDTTIEDFLKSGRKIDDKAFNALYPGKDST